MFYRAVARSKRAVARPIIGGGGGCIFIYSCFARRISFKAIVFTVCEHEYMNIHTPQLSRLATALIS